MRGVAIILVVYLHAWFSAWAVTPHSQVLAIHVIHLFAHSAVPVFFFMSAYLLAHDSSANFGEYVRRKLQRILLPLAVAMTATLLYRLWQEGWTAQLRHDLLVFDLAGQYYYLLVLVVFMAGFWPARFVPQRRLTQLLVVAFAINLATIAWYQSSTISGDFATFAYRNPAVWVFSFAFGYWSGRRGDALAYATRLLPAALAAMAAIMTFYLVRGEGFGDYPVSYFGVSVFLFACCGLAAYPALARMALSRRITAIAVRPFEELSRYAFAIYLFHIPFFLGWLTDTYVSDSAVKTDYWDLLHTRFLVAFVSTTVFVVLAAKLWPRGAELFLGVDPPHRKAENATTT